jgi:hypothetical protein
MLGNMQCTVYGYNLNSMLEVCWEVNVYDDSLNSMLEVWWEVCSVPYINPPNSQGIRTMVSRAGPILVD